jgi:V/A-type H+/Na+-transporting ATPase subunit C
MFNGSVSGYAALHARIRVMFSTLLTPQELDNLCESADIPALVGLLEATPYGPYLSGLGEADRTPKRLVYQIKGKIIKAYESIIRSTTTHTHSLLLHLFRRYEVDNLKAVLRSIVTGASWDRVQYVLFPLGPLESLPLRSLAESGSVEAAVALLHGTPYFDTLNYAMSRYTAEQSLFPLEVALDLNYWRNLWREVNKLRGLDHEKALRIIGMLMDMNNLMWAVRYRVFHNLSEEEIINYTLPFSYHVRDQDIRAIAAGADITQVVRRIYPDMTRVSEIFQDPRNRLSEFELDLQRHIAKQCRSSFAGYPFHIGLPLAYLILCELEVQDLTALVEAKSAHRPAAEFHPYLLVGCPPE